VPSGLASMRLPCSGSAALSPTQARPRRFCQASRLTTQTRPASLDVIIKSELVERVADKNPRLHKTDIQRIVDAVFDRTGSAPAQRNRVELRGFGTFSLRIWPARAGRNPKTGAVVSVARESFPSIQDREGNASSS
jgi:integration host factor subunit beta